MTTDILIGWASADITPDRPVNLYGQFQMRIATKALDPVTATVLALAPAEDKGDGAIFVSADTCVIPGKVLTALRARLKELFPAIPAGNVILNSTHTHTAPAMKTEWHPNLPDGVMHPDDYVRFFVDKVAAAVGEAWGSMRPGALSWGFGYAVVGHNRRTVYLEDVSKRDAGGAGYFVNGHGKLYGDTNDPAFDHMEGSEDHSVNILYTWDAQRRMTGAVVNLPCPSQETEGLSEISADFWHEVRAEIRKRHGGHLFILPQDSAAGGMSPHIMVDKKAEGRMLELKGVSRRQEIGRRVADAFDEILAWSSKDIRSRLEFKREARTLMLPMRPITDAECAQMKEQAELLRQKPGETAALGRCERVMARHELQKTQPDLPFELQTLRLGDIAFATNSFELFTDFGLRIKARSPATQTFLIQHCGSEAHLSGGTYLPTVAAERNKGYSATVYCNIIGHQGGDLLVEETLGSLGALFRAH